MGELSDRIVIAIHGDDNIGIQGNGTFHYNSNIIHPSTGENFGGIRSALWLKLDA